MFNKGVSIVFRHKNQFICALIILTLVLLAYNVLSVSDHEPINIVSIQKISHHQQQEPQPNQHLQQQHQFVNNNSRDHFDILNKLIVESQSKLKKPAHLQSIFAKPLVNDFIAPLNNNKNNNKLESLISRPVATSSNMETDKQILQKLERVVHVDLKGALPKVEYFRGFFKMLKDFGATGILLEYEDVFPFQGRLAEAVAGEHYTMKDIEFIKEQAAENKLYIIPLVQTYGHLEWILKVKSFAHLRDHPDYPQVMSQCLDESYDVIFDMVYQVISAHPDSLYFHVGLDEVYYKLMHPNCSQTEFKGDFTKAFLSHLTKVAAHIRAKLPRAKILIWDDMLHNMDESVMEGFKPKINEYEIEPMIWAYMEDVKNWFQPYLYVKYGHIFKNVWAASAYKGASGELTTVTSIQHHYLNHQTWIEVILEKQRGGIVNFKGIVLTGWSRYDHMLQLCDLLPEAVPSLIYNLQTMQLGQITQDRKAEIGQLLGCSGNIPWTPDEIYFGSIQCSFPGHEVYEAILPINGVIKRAQEAMTFAQLYMTPIHLNYNYLHKMRAHEVIGKLTGEYYELRQFMDRFKVSARTLYSEDTINEWLMVYVTPHIDPVLDMITNIKKNLGTNDWKPRPQKIKLRNYPDEV